MDITGSFEIAKLALHEGDTLVVKTGTLLTKDQCAYIRDSVREYIPAGVKVLVLDGAMSIEVVHPKA